MVSSRLYNTIYRVGAPWDSVGVREDLKELLDSGRIPVDQFPRTIDLGCGSGANVVHLAGLGYDSYGADFSPVALDQARERAVEAGVSDRCTWIEADLAGPSIGGIGEFDLLIDFGTLDDLRPKNRNSMASLITSLARPGAVFLEWCFYGKTEELPWISFKGTSRMSHIAPGELDDLFGNEFEIEPFSENPEWRTACFMLTKR